MNDQEKMAYKNKLKQFCKNIIDHRIEISKAAIENAQQSANSEEKSSAGDKYETARAMSHLERDMHTRQLAENVKELSALHSINTNTIYQAVTNGAFVKCNEISFFIAIGIGKQIIDGEKILFLSLNAPLAKLMENKKASDKFLFLDKEIFIEDVY
ncbi:MAG TPA: hypothetical protein VHZ50_17475 [Puia sp.]|jgi:hypothetical protein|nr:hypothetical protein [Puia sp.]